jgi:hypothetical protein
LRAAQRIDTTPAGEAGRKHWATAPPRAYAIPRQRQEGFPVDAPGRADGDGSRGPKLTAREAAAVLGLSQQELADLVASGVLCPAGPDTPEARRFPAAEVEAVLNGTPLHAPALDDPEDDDATPRAPVVPIGRRAPAGPLPAGSGRLGRWVPAPAGPAGPVAERPPERRPVPPPPRPRRKGPRGGAPAGLTAAKAEPGRRAQARYLRALARAIVGAVGPGADCELRWQENHPFLPYLRVRETQVWTVSTSSGWRFLWNRYRSHPANDAAGAAEMLVADLGLRGGGSGPD